MDRSSVQSSIMSVQKICIILFCIIFCDNVSCSNDIHNTDIDLVVHSLKPNKTNDKFLSVALDTIVVAEKFKHFNMTNKRLINMVSHLAPGYLRIGGNLADRLYFKEHANQSNIDYGKLYDSCFYEEANYCAKNFTNFTMSGTEWQELNKFAEKVGLTILFDLNCLIRYSDDAWDSRNAEELIQFSDKSKFNIHWQLGNEPDAFKHVFNYSVNATQLAKDFVTLKNILVKYPRYKKSLLVGPDVTRPRPEHKASAKYLEDFLNSNSSKHTPTDIDAVTFHQYYLNGRTATLEDFLNPKTFALLETQLKTVKDIVNKTGFNNTPIWLSETGTAYGGGAPRLSNTFAGSFLWLDKLGLAAKYGLQTVIRQSLFRGYYALIDQDYQPSPDWWISVLYKRTVGSEVMACDVNGVSETVRLYCHCTKKVEKNPLQQSAVTVFGVNINPYSAKVNIKGLHSDSNVAFAYIFTAMDMRSKSVRLNGQTMELSEEGEVPIYKPEFLSFDKPMLMPAHSLVFWIIPVKNACMHEDPISVILV